MVDEFAFINQSLSYYLTNNETKDYAGLTNFVIQSNDKASKWNLLTLFMNNKTQELTIENLTNRLKSIYLSDPNIATYVDRIVSYNPKLGHVSITSSSRQDMEDDCSLYIDIPCYSEDADRLIKKVKEVLTMILTESKTIPI